MLKMYKRVDGGDDDWENKKEKIDATTDINILIERDLKYLRRQNAKLKNEIKWYNKSN
jgi:hypothetical protein